MIRRAAEAAGRTVVLAAGDFPRPGGEARRILSAATRVVACDGAALAYRREFGRWPDVTTGDLDSIGKDLPPGALHDADQDENDLSKALALCRRMGWADPIVLGATGKREDHTVGNVFRALAAEVRVVTDCGEFLPVRGRLSFRTWKGAGISVFAPDPRTKMTSRGLRWKLDGVRISMPWRGTLNRASSENAVVTADRPAFVYVERNPAARRAVVSLGSNLGNRAALLRRAIAMLSRMPQTRLLDSSSIAETDPVDVPRKFAAMRFLNQAALFETELSPIAFSRAMHAIEDKLGRVRGVRNGPRTIDLDLVMFEGVEMRSRELVLPHPRAASRDFVVLPLREIGLEVGKW